MPNFDHIFGSPPPTETSPGLNMSLCCVQPNDYQNDLNISMYAASESGFRSGVSLFLLSESQTGSASSSLNMDMRVQTRGTTSNVIPLTIDGVYRSYQSNGLDIFMGNEPDDIMGNCYITEGPNPVEILIDNSLSCVANPNQAAAGCSMFIANDGVAQLQDSLPLTIRWNPAGIVMMSMRVQGTQVIPQTCYLTDGSISQDIYTDGLSSDFIIDQSLINYQTEGVGGICLSLEDNTGCLATPNPLIMNMVGSAAQTQIVNMTLPNSEAAQAGIITMCTRGF